MEERARKASRNADSGWSVINLQKRLDLPTYSLLLLTDRTDENMAGGLGAPSIGRTRLVQAGSHNRIRAWRGSRTSGYSMHKEDEGQGARTSQLESMRTREQDAR